MYGPNRMKHEEVRNMNDFTNKIKNPIFTGAAVQALDLTKVNMIKEKKKKNVLLQFKSLTVKLPIVESVRKFISGGFVEITHSKFFIYFFLMLIFEENIKLPTKDNINTLERQFHLTFILQMTLTIKTAVFKGEHNFFFLVIYFFRGWLLLNELKDCKNLF